MTWWTIATNTLGEAMRKKVINIFLLVAIILIFFSQMFAFFATPGGSINSGAASDLVVNNSRVEIVIIKSMAFGVILLSGLVMAIFLGTDLIPAEIERKTIYTILSKPVRRSSYILGKQVGLALTLVVNVGLMGLAFLALIFFKTGQVQLEVITGILIIAVEFVMLGSVALFFSFVVGMLGEFLTSIIGMTEKGGNKSLAWVLEKLHFIIPNFSNFNIYNPLIHPEKIAEVPNFYVHIAKLCGYGLGYSAVLLLITIFIFDRKEM